MWIFILLGYILPIILIIVGLIFSKHPPRKINSYSGYRTERSMRSVESWKEANEYSAKLLIKYDIYLLVLVTIGLILTNNNYGLMAAIDVISVFVGIGLVFLIIMKTENHLKKIFERER